MVQFELISIIFVKIISPELNLTNSPSITEPESSYQLSSTRKNEIKDSNYY